MTRNQVRRFVLCCINEAEAGGHTALEDDAEGLVPDYVEHDDSHTIHLRYGDEWFDCVIKKRRDTRRHESC